MLLSSFGVVVVTLLSSAGVVVSLLSSVGVVVVTLLSSVVFFNDIGICHMQVVVRNQAEHILFCFIQRVTLNEWCEFVSRSSETAQTYIKHVLLHHHR